MSGITNSPFLTSSLLKPQSLNQSIGLAGAPSASQTSSLLGTNTASPASLSQMPSLSLGMSSGMSANGQSIQTLFTSMLNLIKMMLSMGQQDANQGANANQQPVYQPPAPTPAADTTPVTYTPAPTPTPASDTSTAYNPANYDQGNNGYKPATYTPAPVPAPTPAADTTPVKYTPAPAPTPAADTSKPYNPSNYDQGNNGYKPATYTPTPTPASDKGNTYTPAPTPAADTTPAKYTPAPAPTPATDKMQPYCPPPAAGDKTPAYPAPTPTPAKDTTPKPYDPGSYDNGNGSYKPPVYNNGYDTAPPVYNGGGKGDYWGDPHFNGFDGEKFDVQGENGKIYNLLSDKNVQFNGRFESWGTKGATVVGEVGLQVGDSKIRFDKDDAAPTLNDVAFVKGKSVSLDEGGTALWDGTNLNVKTSEYTFDVKKAKSDGQAHLDTNVSVTKGGNPLADNVAAHGILGQTADGDGLKKGAGTGDQGAGAQGGGVIDTLDANGKVVTSKKGDKTAVNNYQVGDIFGTTGNAFNRFGVQVDQARTDAARQDLNKDGKLDVTTVFDTTGNAVMTNPELLKKQNAGAAKATPVKGGVTAA